MSSSFNILREDLTAYKEAITTNRIKDAANDQRTCHHGTHLGVGDIVSFHDVLCERTDEQLIALMQKHEGKEYY